MIWRRKTFWGIGAIVLLAGVAGLVFSKRSIDLRHFNPEVIARREAHAWRAYYSGHWLTLLGEVYQVGAGEYGLAPGDSLRLGYHAARSAWFFRTGKTPDRVKRAEEAIRPFFQIFSERSGYHFDSAKAAELEIKWWEMRRQLRPPEEWAQTIAEQAGLVFGQPAEDFLPATRLRVQAMVFRDLHRSKKMTEADWAHVEELLGESAARFHAAVNPGSDSDF